MIIILGARESRVPWAPFSLLVLPVEHGTLHPSLLAPSASPAFMKASYMHILKQNLSQSNDLRDRAQTTSVQHRDGERSLELGASTLSNAPLIEALFSFSKHCSRFRNPKDFNIRIWDSLVPAKPLLRVTKKLLIGASMTIDISTLPLYDKKIVDTDLKHTLKYRTSTFCVVQI